MSTKRFNSRFSCFENQSTREFAKMTINKRLSCFFLNQSVHSSNDFYNIHLLETLKHRLIKKKIKITHTHIKSFIFNKQINIQNIKQKNFEFRFVSSVSAICSLEWYSMSSLQRLINLLQWFFSIFYIFAINIKKNEFITSQQRYENKWHENIKNNN